LPWQSTSQISRATLHELFSFYLHHVAADVNFETTKRADARAMGMASRASSLSKRPKMFKKMMCSLFVNTHFFEQDPNLFPIKESIKRWIHRFTA